MFEGCHGISGMFLPTTFKGCHGISGMFLLTIFEGCHETLGTLDATASSAVMRHCFYQHHNKILSFLLPRLPID